MNKLILVGILFMGISLNAQVGNSNMQSASGITFDGQPLNDDLIESLFPNRNQTLITWDYAPKNFDKMNSLNTSGQVLLLVNINSRPNEYWQMLVTDQKCNKGNGCFRGYTVGIKTIITSEIISHSASKFDNVLTVDCKVNNDRAKIIGSQREEVNTVYTANATFRYNSNSYSKWAHEIRLFDNNGTKVYSDETGHAYASSSNGTATIDCEAAAEQWKEDLVQYNEYLFDNLTSGIQGTAALVGLSGTIATYFPPAKVGGTVVAKAAGISAVSVGFVNKWEQMYYENVSAPGMAHALSALCNVGYIDTNFQPVPWKNGAFDFPGDAFPYPCCVQYSPPSETVQNGDGGYIVTYTKARCISIQTCWVEY